VAKYTLPFSKPVKSDHNLNFWYFQNNHIKTTNIFSVRSSPDPAKIGFSPDPVGSSPDPCSSLLFIIWSNRKCYSHNFSLHLWQHDIAD